MKPIELVAYFVFALVIAIAAIIVTCKEAEAQTPTPPPDIVLPPLLETGLYTMKVQIPTQDASDADVFQACCDRVDVDPVIELGCSPRNGTEQVIQWDTSVVKTPGDDAEVRCYTENTQDRSDYSLNAYILPFPLKPNQPTVR